MGPNSYRRKSISPAFNSLQILRHDGFSLIEVAAVVAVIAILSAISIPYFFNLRKDSIIAAAKYSLVQIHTECLAQFARGNRSPSFSDISAWLTHNKYGHVGNHPGKGFIEFTYDTGMYTGMPIFPQDSCLTLAAMSTTIDSPGMAEKIFPDFSIGYDQGKIIKECIVVESRYMYGEQHCKLNSDPCTDRTGASCERGEW